MLPDNYPEISFIDNKTIDELNSEAVNTFLNKYEEITGEKAVLYPANPYKLLLDSVTLLHYQMLQYIDRAGKMNTLRYAFGNYLDNVAEFRGTSRKQATAASTILEFSIENTMENVVAIPQGTRVTNGNDIYFSTDEYAEIQSGESSVKVSATCTEPGVKGDVLVGTLNTIVNSLPYLLDVTNTIDGYGGADIETDEDLRNRVYDFATAYAAAGTIDAYIYHTKEVLRDIEDVVVETPQPGYVDIYFSLQDGEVPTQDVLDIVEDALMDSKVRYLTDFIEVKAPTVQTYDVELTYWIAESNKDSVETISSNVNKAIADFNTWQTSKIGRDINPSMLIQKIMEAGAKRVVVESPIYTAISNTKITKVDEQTITYGGIEHD